MNAAFFSLANLPLIPYLHSAQDVLFAGFIFLRVTGLFLIAPLIDNKHTPVSIRIMLMVFITALLAMSFYPDYRGSSPKYLVMPNAGNSPFLVLEILLIAIKEIATGYLIGICFAFIYEAVYIAGHIVTNLTGLSFASMVDPITGTSQTTISQLFLITTSLLIFALNLHHNFFIFLRKSFDIVPLGSYRLAPEVMQDLIRGSSRFFHYGLQMSAFPLIILMLVTVGLGFMAKTMPEMNVFVIAFPIKILTGYFTLLFALTYFPNILQQAFIEYSNLISVLLLHMQPDTPIP